MAGIGFRQIVCTSDQSAAGRTCRPLDLHGSSGDFMLRVRTWATRTSTELTDAAAGFTSTAYAARLSWNVGGAVVRVGVTAFDRLKALEEAVPLAGDDVSHRARGRGSPGREHR
ncbi:hypothetical protein PV367_02280 [Streptomyces europaeiscabiei]|uniref:Uncharacterized protein n=1 Tax=Streptomyces europaeiscabiei TaxID=146819 RepID=A0AAJ2PJR2_9ACTN|nr:hypothetical protein [Streptomyces europaeiscabiei]